MYVPKYFENQDRAELLELIREYPFATLVSLDGGRPFYNHLPLILESSDQGDFLLGHMARANPQWRHFEQPLEVTALFHGPHTYITPTWYKTPLMVPTWNYAVAHVYGIPQTIHDSAGVLDILQKSVAVYESGEETPWRLELPEKFTQDLIRAIVGFKIPITRIEGKFKLSQQRKPQERINAIEGLKGRSDEMSAKVLELMQRALRQSEQR